MHFVYRLLSPVLVVALLSFSLPSLASPGRSLRQHVEPRATFDVCATIDAAALESANLILPPDSYAGCLELCLCLSSLTITMNTNDVVHELTETYGAHLVKKDITMLVSQSIVSC
jgi:hypothetical protein